MTKDEAKTEVLDAFLASVFNGRTCSPCVQLPKLEDGGREWNETPITQEELVNDLLQH